MFATHDYELEIPGGQDVFLRYAIKGAGQDVALGCPWFEVDGLWQCTPDVDLDIVAQAVDTAGYGDQQRKKHQLERRAYRRARTRRQIRETAGEK